MVEREPLHRGGRSHVEDFGRLDIAPRIPPIARELQGDGGAERGARRRNERGVSRGGGHLKSRLENMATAPSRSAAMYTAAYPVVASMYPLETGRPWTTCVLTSKADRSGSTW